MKKQILFFGALGLILLNACKEVGPVIDLTPVIVDTSFQAIDTTYLAAPETPQLRTMLIEEATGVQCPNCPAGTNILKQAETNNAGRVLVVGLHAGNLTTPIDKPPYKSKYDFRTTFALSLFTYFGSEPNKPASIFDRTKQGSTYFSDARNSWLGIINNRLTVPTAVNLTISSHFDAVAMKDTIRLKVSYTQTVSKSQALTILIVEDSIIDVQDSVSNYVVNYKHNNVLRTMITPFSGTRIIEEIPVKSPGRVYEKAFLYKLPDEAKNWNLDKCRIIAFVHSVGEDDKEVAQAADVHLK